MSAEQFVVLQQAHAQQLSSVQQQAWFNLNSLEKMIHGVVRYCKYGINNMVRGFLTSKNVLCPE